jgi:hypothetical protein
LKNQLRPEFTDKTFNILNINAFMYVFLTINHTNDAFEVIIVKVNTYTLSGFEPRLGVCMKSTWFYCTKKPVNFAP